MIWKYLLYTTLITLLKIPYLGPIGSTKLVLPKWHKGAFNNYVDKMRGGGGQKMSVFVHAQGIKTVHAGGGVKEWQKSVHVVVECPLSSRIAFFLS